MSKALASVGGFVAGRREVGEFLNHNPRAFMCAAAQPPAAAAAACAALEIIEREPERRQRLWANTERFQGGLRRMGYDIGGSVTPIVPILLGRREVSEVMKLVARIEELGLFICAISLRRSAPTRRSSGPA
jgi:7-keto-8-aminopelargonate synthetase-like enzyme